MLRSIIAILIAVVMITACKKEKPIEPQADIDERVIQEYLQKHNIQATRTSSGLYYVITDSTQEKTPPLGTRVFVEYKGQYLDGVVFDSTDTNPATPNKEYIDFVLGRGEVIRGWDEGIALMRKRERAIFLIPSHLAYGRGTVLRFDVYLRNF